jgi:predicted CxxxxCH...CXXCH cytochrome family protein
MISELVVEDKVNGTAVAATDTAATVRFLDMLNEAAALLRKRYPGAQFLEADIDLETFGCGWRFVFDVPPAGLRDSRCTAILCHNGQSFQEPQHIEAPWSSDQPIPLPLDLDVEEAKTLARRAGYDGAVASASLRWVLYPGIDEPHYILSIPEKDVLVFVGAYTRKVTVGPLTV